MTKTITTTTCDFCGCEIGIAPYGYNTRLGFGVRLKVRSGFIGKWERFDLCDRCYNRMVRFCAERAKDGNNGK